MSRVLDDTGDVKTTFEVDGKNWIIGYEQDCNDIVDNNVALQTENDGYSPSKDLRRVASIPVTAFHAWCKQRGLLPRHVLKNWKHYKDDIRKMVYDSDNRMFLTAPHKKPARPKIQGLDAVIADGRKLGTG